MANFPKEIANFMAKYEVDADEIWKIPQGNAYAVKHKALERVAVEQKISFEPPTIIEARATDKIAVICVRGHMGGERMEWSIGEASPANNKNAYCFAMAEKRAKDRVVLKLLQAHGAIYSEDEADEFKRENPHVTKPEDLSDAKPRYDDNGQRFDWIDTSEHRVERLTKAKARPVGDILNKAMLMCKTPAELVEWGVEHSEQVASLPQDWEEIFQNRYQEFLDELRSKKEAA